jgi:hypothetical protein
VAAAVVNPAADRGQGQSAEAVVLGHSQPVGAFKQLELGDTQVKGAEEQENQEQQDHGASANGTEVLANVHHRDYLSLRAR